MIRTSTRFLMVTISFLIIALAFIVSVARIFFPLFQEYKADVERWATEELGREVKVNKIRADWGGLQPRLRIKGIRVMTKEGNRTWVKLDEVQIYFRLIDSVRNWRLTAGKINVVGAEIKVEFKDGLYYVGGVPIENKQQVGESRVLNWLIERQKLVLSKARIDWKDPRISHETLRMRNIDLLLHAESHKYHLSGSFSLKRQKDSSFFFILNLFGDFKKLEAMRRQFYFSGNAQLGNWVNKQLLADTDVQNGDVVFRLWGDGIGKLEKLFGDIDFRKLKWKRRVKYRVGDVMMASDRFFSVDRISGNFNWRMIGEGWDLSVKKLKWIRRGKSWPISSVKVQRLQLPDKRERYTGKISYARIEDVGHLMLSVLPIQNEVRDKIITLDPSGDIKGLEFSFLFDNSSIADYYFKTDFKRLSINRWKKIPGIKNWQGQIQLNKLGGFVMLDSHKARAEIPYLFARPLVLDRLAGLVSWRADEKGLTIESDELIASNRSVKTSTRVKVQLQEKRSPHIDLVANFHGGVINDFPRHLPVKIMKPKLVKWLVTSIKNGKISKGQFVYKGHSSEFPFERGNGIFNVQFDVDGMALRYHPKWPKVEDMSGTVRFYSNSLTCEFRSGSVFGMELLPMRVGITTLNKDGILKLNGGLLGPTSDLMKFIASIPVEHKENRFITQFKSSGNSMLHLGLTLPLFNMEKRSYAGRIEFMDSALKHKNWNLAVDELNGELSFSSAGKFVRVDAEKLLAKYKKRPMSIKVISQANPKTKSLLTQIGLRVHSGFDDLFDGHSKTFKGLIVGNTDWFIGFDVLQTPRYKPKTRMRIESQLQGVQIKLPDWLGKRRKERRQFWLETNVGGDRLGVIRLRYGKSLTSALQFSVAEGKTQFRRGEIRFGGDKAELPDTDGLRLVGRLKSFSVSNWIDWANRRRQAARKNQDSLLEYVNKLDLNMNHFELVGNHIHNVLIKARRDASHWYIDVNGKEVVGKIRVPLIKSDKRPLVMQMSHVQLKESEDDRKRAVPDPRQLPPLRIKVDRFFYNDAYHGSLIIAASKTSKGLKFEALDMSSKHLKIQAHGRWDYERGLHLSRFNITAKSDNLGKALANRNYGVALAKGTAEVTINSYWRGPPSWFKLKSVNGEMSVSIRKGRLVSVKTRGGKLVGMLSLSALPRRLALDFSDVFKKGFAFDKITGTFTISKGDAFTNNLKMIGPAANIEITGRTGLADQDYDQKIYVTPRLSANLPVIGGLAAGPQVGVGLFIADKMFGKKLNKFSKSQYTVQGTWEKPIIKKVRKKRKEFVDDATDDT